MDNYSSKAKIDIPCANFQVSMGVRLVIEILLAPKNSFLRSAPVVKCTILFCLRDVDEEDSGKFTLTMFCQIASRYIQYNKVPVCELAERKV